MKLSPRNLWSGASAVAATTVLLLSATPARAAGEATSPSAAPAAAAAAPRVSVVAGATALNQADKAAIDGGLAGCTTVTTRYYVWVPLPGIVTVWVPVEYARVESTVCD